jgi:hypothetical protein
VAGRPAGPPGSATAGHRRLVRGGRGRGRRLVRFGAGSSRLQHEAVRGRAIRAGVWIRWMPRRRGPGRAAPSRQHRRRGCGRARSRTVGDGPFDDGMTPQRVPVGRSPVRTTWQRRAAGQPALLAHGTRRTIGRGGCARPRRQPRRARRRRSAAVPDPAAGGVSGAGPGTPAVLLEVAVAVARGRRGPGLRPPGTSRDGRCGPRRARAAAGPGRASRSGCAARRGTRAAVPGPPGRAGPARRSRTPRTARARR